MWRPLLARSGTLKYNTIKISLRRIVDNTSASYIRCFQSESAKWTLQIQCTQYQHSPICGNQLKCIFIITFKHNEYYVSSIYLLLCLLLFHYVRSQSGKMALFHSQLTSVSRQAFGFQNQTVMSFSHLELFTLNWSLRYLPALYSVIKNCALICTGFSIDHNKISYLMSSLLFMPG